MTNRTLVVDVEPPNNSEPQIRQLPTPTTPRDARIIALVLASMGVQSSFKGVVRYFEAYLKEALVRHILHLPMSLTLTAIQTEVLKPLTARGTDWSTLGLLASIALQLRRPAYPTLPWEPDPISGGGTLSAVGTSNQAAALHARRFSTIARDPSVAIVSPNLSAAGNNNESVNITEGQKQLLLVKKF
ncbi:hypothetical protein BY996DRAFT_6559365 [Phakopsora pachyrhizi]|uniref:ABC transporter domain-containing protein n=1 Tax=Phakopsora pachyrhizi TaxID=170000 RepID=A0AAV0B046_PHAPC|nr:hypothetical protein BY996DRAFT_6559365 [Phakopsora pachyrhizi]CAH7675343.1 hypothetical protein PPACK8108_LOCUS10340 [Phakopsora pachyrhizi]